MSYRYKNPNFSSGRPDRGPEYFETENRPRTHLGFQIFFRVPGGMWDVVLSGKCLSQHGTFEAAQWYCQHQIDKIAGRIAEACARGGAECSIAREAIKEFGLPFTERLLWEVQKEVRAMSQEAVRL